MIQWQLQYFSEIDSTNKTMCRDANAADLPEGLVYVADCQTGGRGLGENVWCAEQGKNLLFSFLLRPSFLRADRQFRLSKVVCLSLFDVLSPHVDDVQIKWPNDIWVGDKKIAGVLIENSLAGSTIRHTVVGIGLNVNQQHFPAALPNPVSLSQLTARTFDLSPLLYDFLENLSGYYKLLEEQGVETIDKRYLQRLYRYQVPARYQSDAGEFEGVISGVDASGRLQVVMPKGESQSFFFKEIVFL